MDDRSILDELVTLLDAQGVQVRAEPMGGCATALCKLRDKYVFFLDTDAPAMESAVICARAVNRFVNAENIYLRPEIRDFLEKYPPDNKSITN